MHTNLSWFHCKVPVHFSNRLPNTVRPNCFCDVQNRILILQKQKTNQHKTTVFNSGRCPDHQLDSRIKTLTPVQNHNSYPRCILVWILIQHTKPTQKHSSQTSCQLFFILSWIVKIKCNDSLHIYFNLLQANEVLAFTSSLQVLYKREWFAWVCYQIRFSFLWS